MAVEFYDVMMDERREVTQEDVDKWQSIFAALSKYHVEHPREDPKMPCDYRLEMYANKMRIGRYFVAQEKPMEPYPGVRGLDGPIYPSVPLGSVTFGNDLPEDVAAELVRRWNAFA